MPIELQCDDCPVKATEALRLWQETTAYRHFPDDQVNIRCVSATEARTLNRQYRGKDAPTNVLTFSYPSTDSHLRQGFGGQTGQVDEHDVALCMPVAKEEAHERNIPLRDYTALLLTHAFLHATGLDHEKSSKEEQAMGEAERAILERAGFSARSL